MKTAFALGALATLMVAGAAVAHLTVDLTAAGEGIYYLPNPTDSRDHGIYEESNGCEGLQEEPVDCRGDEELEPADTRLDQ